MFDASMVIKVGESYKTYSWATTGLKVAKSENYSLSVAFLGVGSQIMETKEGSIGTWDLMHACRFNAALSNKVRNME